MYEEIITELYKIVATGLSSVYPIYPSDFKGESSSTPFIKMNFVFAKAERYAYQHKKEISGMIVFQIFYDSGYGQKQPATIANLITTYFEDKLVKTNLQTSLGSLEFLGPDRDDTTLSRADYSVPFTYYGE